jgi:hypothetical protein
MTGLGWRVGAALAAIAVASGCLQKDVSQTWYLEGATGTVTWSLLEDHVRSDARGARDRDDEERTYLLAVQRDDHTAARAFRQLGFLSPRTRILRDSVPFTVLTDAGSARIDVLGERIILHGGLAGTSVLTSHEGVQEWTMTIRDPQANGGPAVSDDIADLMGGLEQLVVVLSTGVFGEAEGFTVGGDRRTARLHLPDGDSSADAPIRLRLQWRP